MIAYKVKLEPDDDTLLVTSADLPGLVTYGGTTADALKYAVGALEELIASEIADGGNVPRPRRTTRLRGDEALVALPALSAIKLELYWALRAAKMTRAELGAPPRVESGISGPAVPA